ncbi:hypothetical protein ACFL17_09720, partial [Pseudomonadota bacterium]
ALKEGKNCLVRFELFEQHIIIPRQKRTPAICHYAQKFASRLERECMKHPLQWYNFYEFWKKAEIRGKNHYQITC